MDGHKFKLQFVVKNATFMQPLCNLLCKDKTSNGKGYASYATFEKLMRTRHNDSV